MKYTAKQIASLTGANVFGPDNHVVEHLAFDSRNIFTTHHVAFIALDTPRNSGHRYIQDAITKGIKTIICREQQVSNDEICWIVTDDTANFLRVLARKHLEALPHLKTIGITGSNGKTIVKEWLHQCLYKDFATVKSPKSFNSQIGLPLSVLQSDQHHEIGIFEAGISEPGEMQILQQILQPKIGILTFIGTAHLSHFKDETELINEKIKLFSDADTIFYNGDKELTNNLLNNIYSNKELISFGLKPSNKYHVTRSTTADCLFVLGDEQIELRVEQQDDATLNNAIGVCAVLKHLGYSAHQISEKINELKSVEMRLESIEGQNKNLIINDSYNLDKDSLKIAFQFIKSYQKKNKILVLTDFIDVTNPDEFYADIARLTNEQNFSKVFLIGEEIGRYHNVFKSETFTFNDTNELSENQIFNAIENSLILIKGARKFQTDRLKEVLQLQKHDTVLEVNLNALLHNINEHRRFLKPETKMMAMVKAFAYGTGGFEVAEFLQHHHIDYLGVAYADEGVELRKKGITVPIMVMNPEQHSYDAVIDYQLEPEIYSFRLLDMFCNRLMEKGVQEDFPVHIKLETGMHRLGFQQSDIQELIIQLKTKNVKVLSIFSHLSTADVPEEKDYALQQLEAFERMSSQLMAGLGYTPMRHILNSAGITYFPEYQYDMVRMGIGMYGTSYNPQVKSRLQSVVKFKTLISQISHIQPGDSVGYGRGFQSDKPAKIATLPVGYADGIRRLAGNGIGHVGIRGQLAPIVGRVCMDMMMVDVSGIEAKEGDEVVIFNGNPALEDFADYSQTIPYEVLTSISRRVKRIYIKN